MDGGGQQVRVLRGMNSAPVKLKPASHATIFANGVLTEDETVFGWLDSEDAEVEQLVMKRAQRQTVLLGVRPSDVVPLDMCGFKACGHVADPQAEATNAAAVLVGAQHTFSKARIASAAFLLCVTGSVWLAFVRRRRPVKVKSHSGGDVPVQSGWEVGLKNAGGNGLKQARDMAQGVVDLWWKTCPRMLLSKFAQRRRGTGCSIEPFGWTIEIPQCALAVGGQVPERVVTGVGRASAAELGEQPLHRAVDVGEFHEPRIATLYPGQRQKNQERLVRRVDTRSLRATDVLEGVQNFGGCLHLMSPQSSSRRFRG